MARKTNKAQVLELAARLGVEVEYGQTGSEGFEVALYGYDASMTNDPLGGGHTAITNQAGTGARTEARIWGLALEDLHQFVPCPEDCHCRTVAAPQGDDEDLDVVDATPAPGHIHPIVTGDDGSPIVSNLPYVITDEDSGAEYVGTALSAATSFESMRTMVALSLGVSRETVRLWETDNYREYGFDAPHGRRGTVRFTVASRNPYRPEPVTLTHSHLHHNA